MFKKNLGREELEQICARIETACARVGRDPNGVLLIGASKGVSAETLQKFLEAGLKDCGENYVQEGIAKMEVLRSREATWHLIGALQSNKAREAVEYFGFIHSVDRPSIIAALDKAARERNKIQNVLIQVNSGYEESKSGCAPHDASPLAAQIHRCENLTLCGLMCLPPYDENPETRRPYFRALRNLRDEILETDKNAIHLSMGMSHDFEIAIEEGATMIRIGTALFGERKNNQK